MARINIDKVTYKRLAKGEFRESFPEYYDLASVVEVNGWHDHQTVLDHVLLVYKNLEEILTSVPVKLASYLDQPVSRFTRGQLLKIMTLVHDLAKKQTLVTDPSGKTRCPGHELVGSGLVNNFQSRFGLDDSDSRRVREMVVYHDLAHSLLDISIRKQEDHSQLKLLTSTVPDFWPELLLFTHADMLGSDVVTAFPDEFTARQKILVFWLNSF